MDDKLAKRQNMIEARKVLQIQVAHFLNEFSDEFGYTRESKMQPYEGASCLVDMMMASDFIKLAKTKD